ncbi:MAG: hypothetical protein AAF944_26945 [Bacteroidota bacterium]
MNNNTVVRQRQRPKLLFTTISERYWQWGEWLLIIGFCIIPLFVKFPFRINLFLAWEGAYRLAEGQIPFRDFGMPLGFGFWIIPALFFKLLGSQMITLVKAQVFINAITFISFRSIIKTLGLEAARRITTLLVMGLTYVLINFWPWYNNMVFVYELLAIQMLLLGCYRFQHWKAHLFIVLSTLFVVLAIFTKQDGGGLTLILVSALALLYMYRHREWQLLGTYAMSGILWGALFIFPFLSHDFNYWFNFGQPPHYSRINLYDFLDDIFGGSLVIKLYVALIIALLIYHHRNWVSFWQDEKTVMFTLLSLGILGQALLIQVTSYIPHNVNVYFHSFAIAMLLFLAGNSLVHWNSIAGLFLSLFFTFFCFSGDYWLYANRVFRKILPQQSSENVISKSSWSASGGEEQPTRANWVESDYEVFEDVKLPEETIQGIENIESLEIVQRQGDDLKVLNMSELTPLAQILDYTPETGSDYPLWFHYGVSMFDREVDMFCRKVGQQEYDLVLFETIPNLNNFYPEQVQNCLQQNYKMVDRFLAPRIKHNAYIEVYTRD